MIYRKLPSVRVRPAHSAKHLVMAYAIRFALPAVASTAVLSTPGIAYAQMGAPRAYDIPSGPLSAGLMRVAAEAGLTLSADAALTAGRAAPALKGTFSPREAFDRLLAGSGLEVVITGSTVVVRRAAAVPSPEVTLGEVKVQARPDARFGDLPPELPGFRAEFQDSATKTPLSIRETPQSISVITRDSMDERQVRDAATALELASGVVSGRSGQGGPFAGRGLSEGGNFNIRGQELNSERDVRVDGFAISSSSFDLAAFERVEAVKGPSSMLYGQGSLGGFINLVRKKPLFETAISAVAQGGSFDTKRVEVDATGPLGKARTVAGRITAVYDDSGSFTDGVKTRIAMVAPSLEARIGERTRVLAQVMHQDEEYVPSQGVPLKIEGSRARAPAISRSTFVGVPAADQSTATNTLASVRVDHELNDRWLASLFVQHGRQKNRRFFDNYGYSFTGLAGGLVNLSVDTAQLENHNWAGELRFDGRVRAFGRDHRVLVGFEKNQRKNRTAFGYAPLGVANIYTEDFTAFGTIPGGAAAQPFLVDQGRVSENQAFYGQVVLSLTERTKLVAGVRHDRSDQEQRDNIVGVVTDTKRDTARTMRLGATHELTRNVTAYVSYAESFNPVDSLAQGGIILDPETGKGYEAGVKTEWFGKRLAATLAVFRQYLDNRPIPDPTNPLFSISGGRIRTDGIEIEVSGSPYPGVTVGAAATWLDNKHVDPADPDFGLRPYDSVDRMAAIFAGYEFQGGPLKGFGAGATLVSMGKRSLSFFGNGAFFGSGTDELFVDGYERVDLNFHYKGLRDWTISAHVRNVADKTYIERVRDASGSNYFGSPRAVLVRAAYRFR